MSEYHVCFNSFWQRMSRKYRSALSVGMGVDSDRFEYSTRVETTIAGSTVIYQLVI